MSGSGGASGLGGAETGGAVGSAYVWHIPAEVLAAYVGEHGTDADGWSVESHLVQCGRCRGRLTALVAASPLASVVARSRVELVEALPAARPATRRRRIAARPVVPAGAWSGPGPLSLVARSLGRWPWLVAVVVSAGAAFALSWGVGVLRPGGAGFPLNWALAPVVPLAGVALTHIRRSDPWAEVVLSTPTQGLALVSWRCVAVLAVSAPLTLVVGQVPGASGAATSAGMSLAVMLALSLVSLALGTRFGAEAAAVVVAVGWSTVTVFPIVLSDQILFAVIAPDLLPVWAAVAALSAGLVVARRDTFEQLPSRGLRSNEASS